ncbi:hypothetical protein B0H13DRAFT_2651679 [Mycena leptocephala]|nr:hypothetical protein B0H13DRAFT_2651679 [Mycena leptocephala]
MPFILDTILGALLVGTWANSVLYTVEVIQAAYYYRHFKHDNWMLKLLVLSTVAIDSVSMFANYASVYLYTITHWGVSFHLIYNFHCLSLPFLRRFGVSAETVLGKSFRSSRKKHNRTYVMEQPLPLYIFATGIVAALVQIFLAGRYWLLTKNKFITLILFFFIAVAAGGAFACGATIAIFSEYTNRSKALIPATTWLIAEAVTDISIASALLWELRKVKSSFKETRSLRNRLVTQTIQTGATGATLALVILVVFLVNNESNGELLGFVLSIPGSHIPVPTGIAYCLGRVYCLTMLANLNARKPGNTASGTRISSGTNLGTRGERGNQGRSEGGDDYGGIHVHRTVHIDTQQEFSMTSFKTNPNQSLPGDSPAGQIEMTVNDSAWYSSKKKQDPFAA